MTRGRQESLIRESYILNCQFEIAVNSCYYYVLITVKLYMTRGRWRSLPAATDPWPLKFYDPWPLIFYDPWPLTFHDPWPLMFDDPWPIVCQSVHIQGEVTFLYSDLLSLRCLKDVAGLHIVQTHVASRRPCFHNFSLSSRSARQSGSTKSPLSLPL